jgi:hypothetical protein
MFRRILSQLQQGWVGGWGLVLDGSLGIGKWNWQNVQKDPPIKIHIYSPLPPPRSFLQVHWECLPRTSSSILNHIMRQSKCVARNLAIWNHIAILKPVWNGSHCHKLTSFLKWLSGGLYGFIKWLAKNKWFRKCQGTLVHRSPLCWNY